MVVVTKPIIPTFDFEAIFQQIAKNLEQPQSLISLYDDIEPVSKEASFNTRDTDGWQIEGGNIKGLRYHFYNSSFASNEFIDKPGEYFSCRASKWLVFGVTIDPLAYKWYALSAGIFNYLSSKGQTLEHHKIELTEEGKFIEEYRYRSLGTFVPSSFVFQISKNGDSVLVFVDDSLVRLFEHKIGARLYFYGTGVGSQLEISNLIIGKKISDFSLKLQRHRVILKETVERS